MHFDATGTAADYYVWLGGGDRMFGTQLYQSVLHPGRAFPLIDVGPLVEEGGIPSKDQELRMFAPDSSLPVLEIALHGIVWVELWYIYSLDWGQTWQDTGVVNKGRVSSPIYTDGVISATIVSSIAAAHKGAPLFWSDESQQRRFPGDTSLRFMSVLAEGIYDDWEL